MVARAVSRQVWRVLTNFLYFGPFGISMAFHLLFMVRHGTMLEETYRGKTSGYALLMIFCATGLLVRHPSPLAPPSVQAAVFVQSQLGQHAPLFLGPSLAMCSAYIWGRRNPHTRLSLFGVLQFDAPYLPWVIIVIESILSQARQ